MRYYYIPLCSKDFTFENIFASESISPASFYPQRGFGIDYFYLVPEVQHKDAIILYNQPPRYEPAHGNADLVKFILAVTEETLDKEKLVFLKEGIFGYPATIYLTQNNFKLFFFAEKEKKITLLRAETSLPTKGLKKYESNFKLITAEECKAYDYTGIASLVFADEHIGHHLQFDRQVNYFKGFLYGVLAGILNTPSKDQGTISNSFAAIANVFAEFKNRLENTGSAALQVDGYFRKLNEMIGQSEKLFNGLFPGAALTQDDLVLFLQKKWPHHFPSLEKARDYLLQKLADDEILGTRHEAKIRGHYIKHGHDKKMMLYFDVLRDAVAAYRAAGRQPSQWARNNKDEANEQFKEAFFELEKFAEAEIFKTSSGRHAEAEGISYDFRLNTVQIQPSFQNLSSETLEEFRNIVNIILANPKSGKGETSKQQILSLVERVGSLSLKNKQGKETLLYQYLNNEITAYSVEKITSVATKNFVAFIFNIDSLEKLSNYLAAKNIELRWMSFAFWCAFHGFANVSRNFLKVIFDSSNEAMQVYADNYIWKVMVTAKHIDSQVQKSILTAISELPPSPHQNPIKRSKRGFFDEFVAGKFTVSYEEFDAVTQIDDKDRIVQAFKDKINIPKKDGKKIIDAYKNYIDPKALF